MKRRPFKLKSGNNPSIAKFMGVSPIKDNGNEDEETTDNAGGTDDANTEGAVTQEKELTPEELEKQKKEKRKRMLKNIGKVALAGLEGGLNKAYGTSIKATSILDDKKDSEDKYKTLQEKYAELEAKLKLKDDDKE